MSGEPLFWPEASPIRIRVPYPVVGVRFLDYAGRTLENDATIALENLPGCKVEAIVPSSEPPPTIIAKLKDAHDRSPRFARDSDSTFAVMRSQKAA